MNSAKSSFGLTFIVLLAVLLMSCGGPNPSSVTSTAQGSAAQTSSMTPVSSPSDTPMPTLTNTPLPTPSPTPVPIAYTKDARAILRDGPGDLYIASGEWLPGEPRQVIGRSYDEKWLKVATSDGTGAWVLASSVNLGTQGGRIPIVIGKPKAPLQPKGWQNSAVRTVCLEIEKAYPRRQPEDDTVEQFVSQILEGLGLHVLEPGQPCDAQLTISMRGQALGATYSVTVNSGNSSSTSVRTCYTGADLAVSLALRAPGQPPVDASAGGRIDPSEKDSECPDKEFAPFSLLWGDALSDVLGQAWGPRVFVDLGSGGFREADEPAELLISLAVDALLDQTPTVRLDAAALLDELGWKPTLDEAGAAYWAAKGDWRSVQTLQDFALTLFLTALREGGIREYAATVLDEIGWKPDRSANAAYYFAAKGQWDQCSTIGELAVEPLIAVLKENQPEMRDKCAAVLGEIGDIRAVEPLMASLGEGNSAAARALGQLGDLRAFEPVLAALGDEDWQMREAAAAALGDLGDARAFDALVAALGDQQPVAICAAVSLGKIGDPRAIEPLMQALQHEYDGVRSAAATGLASLGDPRAIEALLAALKNVDDEWGRVPFVSALASIGPASIDPLISAIQESSTTGGPFSPGYHEYQNLAVGAVSALGQIEDPRAIAGLISALNLDDNDFPDSVALAAFYLGERSEIQAVEALMSTLKESYDREVISAIAVALGKLGDKRAISVLRGREDHYDDEARLSVGAALWILGAPDKNEFPAKALSDAAPPLRIMACDVLGRLRDPLAVVPLIAALENDNDGSVRRAATRALGAIGDARAVKALIAALGDKDYTVTQAAAWSLGDLGDRGAVEPLITALALASQNYERSAIAGQLMVMESTASALEGITGQGFSTCVPCWQQWWEGQPR